MQTSTLTSTSTASRVTSLQSEREYRRHLAATSDRPARRAPHMSIKHRAAIPVLHLDAAVTTPAELLPLSAFADTVQHLPPVLTLVPNDDDAPALRPTTLALQRRQHRANLREVKRSSSSSSISTPSSTHNDALTGWHVAAIVVGAIAAACTLVHAGVIVLRAVPGAPW